MKSFARWCSFVGLGLCLGVSAVGCGGKSQSNSAALAPAPCTPPVQNAVPAQQATTAQAAQSAAPAVAATATLAAKDEKADKKSDEQGSSSKAKAAVKNLKAPLTVKRLVVAQGVSRSKREPVGAAASFKAKEADKLYAFMEIENPTSAESEVFVTFEPEGPGDSQGQVSLRVGGSPKWRTWAFTRGANKPGKWTLVVRNTDGEVLAKTPFEVQ